MRFLGRAAYTDGEREAAMSERQKRRRRARAPLRREPSGDPREMSLVGEAISGVQPEIGDKDIGERAGVPPRRPDRTRRRT